MEAIESENGLVEILKADNDNFLPPVVRRRLRILQAEVNGATKVAQSAINTHTGLREQYETAFKEACEDYGIPMPDGPHDVDINWVTGQVKFIPKVGP